MGRRAATRVRPLSLWSQAGASGGTIALAGNPNTGKSTLFNTLTGSRQHVGNWPGKTVSRKTGEWRTDGLTIQIVDLPGTYSLSAYSLEEIIARNFIVDERPDVVVVVVDAANVERNLYLATQILEMRGDVLLALNMADAAAARGVDIDSTLLAERLGAPVIVTAASKGQGVEELKAAMLAAVGARDGDPSARLAPDQRPAVEVDYGPELEREIGAVVELIRAHDELSRARGPRWTAIKLLEGDPLVTALVVGTPGTEEIVEAARAGSERLERSLGDDVDTLVADARYGWIHDLAREAVRRPPVDEITMSDRIDAIVTHRYLGLPLFMLAMWLVFKLTTDVSAPYVAWIASVVGGPLASWTSRLLQAVGLGGTWVEGLIVDGALTGVGGVMAFVPVLMSLYFVLALLEDSGYMARAAFVMDRLMRGFGLHGKSFLPMLVGFGCTVPAIYATRTLKNERDRILTGLLVPFMSCGARLPVYVLFAAVFFPRHAGTVVFSMYVVGIITAVILGLVLQSSVLRTGEQTPFVMELPPYRVPTLRGVLTHMWSRTRSFVKKAWTIILAVSVLLWLFMALPPGDDGIGSGPVDESLFARAATAAAPLFAPLGFDSWQATGSLMTGLVAKEVVVSTMAQVYGAGAEDLSVGDLGPTVGTEAGEPASDGLAADLRFIAAGFARATRDTLIAIPAIFGIDIGGSEQAEDGPGAAPSGERDDEPSEMMAAIHADFERSSGGVPAAAGLAFMVFVLLYTPCVVAIAAARHEFGPRWMWTSVLGQFAVAWLVALAVYQFGRLVSG